jgi:GLPGLI family protein
MRFIIPFLLFFICISCKDFSNSHKVNEGIIEYDITYLESKMTSIPTHLLPTKMIYKFNKEYSSISIGFMGVFELSNISNLKKGLNVTTLKILENKFLSETGDEACCYDSMPKLKIKRLKERKVIAGISCKGAEVYFSEKGDEHFNIWYTDSIASYNLSNPYSDVDGMLLEFRMRLNNLNMLFTAHRIEKQKVDNDEFETPKDYKKISKKTLRNILKKLMI